MILKFVVRCSVVFVGVVMGVVVNVVCRCLVSCIVLLWW